MKKLLTLLLTALIAVTCCLGFVACGEDSTVPYEGIKQTAYSDIKAGLICIEGELSTYDKNFMNAFDAACDAKGIKAENRFVVTEIPEGEECYEAAVDLVNKGCNYIFADSFGHEAYILKAALEYPNVQFCHATGTKAHTAGRGNFHNAFASIYQGRYLAGYVAGLKLLETPEKADASNNFQVGYVGAFEYAEVISGYTSWFLGLKAALAENSTTAYTATMKVQFTSSWYSPDGEATAAQNLINKGCVLVSQHADSMGAPNACEDTFAPETPVAGKEYKEIYNVSYNGSTKASCPNSFLVASRINWEPYFEFCFDCMNAGTEIPCDYSKGLDDVNFDAGSVCLTELGDNVAEGTLEKIQAVRTELVNGTRQVFDCSKFTVGGKNLTSYLADVNDFGDYMPETEVIIKNNGITYFAESLFRSAPYFNIAEIDGIQLLNHGF